MYILNFFSILYLLLPLNLLVAQDVATEETWPRKIEGPAWEVVIYQPQIESFVNDRLEARAAIMVTVKDSVAPVFGAMWFDCRMATDRDERTVSLLDVEVLAAKFPDASEESVNKLIEIVENEIPRWEIVLSLDQLLADLDMDSESQGASGFNNEAPEIIFSTQSAVLVLVDGDPIWKETTQPGYEVVVNSPFFIARETKKSRYYIRGGFHWYESSGLADEWKHIENPPKKIEELAAGYLEEEAQEPEEKEAIDARIPEVFVRTNPAELLQSNGEPQFEPIQGTSLLFMKNTDDDVLMDINTQEYYILVSGRWYKSGSMTSGQWTFVHPDDVPEDFSNIPEDSEMSVVRSSVAGTQEAREAVLENQIPQTAEISREDASLTVTYDGDPEFKAIEGTNMQYALNTEQSVLLIAGTYYCCDNAVWFESGSATGPWEVSVTIPEDVQDIPADCPVYNVKYVYVYDYTPSVVYVGYTPGYTHSYVYMGTVYYGTGWYYHPWYGTVYYPRPVTYGFRVHYNPYTGWGYGMTVSRGWVTVSFRSHPGYWGPTGYRHGYRHGYNQGRAAGYRAGYAAGQRSTASSNVYRNRSNGVARTGGQAYNPRTGQARTAGNQPATRPQTGKGGGANNVYTDKNGNVYRNNGNNNWQTRENGQWKDASTATREGNRGQDRSGNTAGDRGQAANKAGETSRGQNQGTRQGQPGNYNRSGQPGQNYNQPGGSSGRNYNDLNRDANSRNRGNQRTNNYNQNKQNYQYQRSGSGSRPSGSARPAGGSRSGGGRRR